MKYGARNQILATVTRVKKGTVMAQIDVTSDGTVDMSSVLTVESLDELALAPGDKVRVVVKAIHVLLVKE